jgi:hypothetical protein
MKQEELFKESVRQFNSNYGTMVTLSDSEPIKLKEEKQEWKKKKNKNPIQP